MRKHYHSIELNVEVFVQIETSNVNFAHFRPDQEQLQQMQVYVDLLAGNELSGLYRNCSLRLKMYLSTEASSLDLEGIFILYFRHRTDLYTCTLCEHASINQQDKRQHRT